jgi:hypothetical protein
MESLARNSKKLKRYTKIKLELDSSLPNQLRKRGLLE